MATAAAARFIIVDCSAVPMSHASPLYCPVACAQTYGSSLEHQYVEKKRDGCRIERRCKLCDYQGYVAKSCDFDYINSSSFNIDGVIMRHCVCKRCRCAVVLCED